MVDVKLGDERDLMELSTDLDSCPNKMYSLFIIAILSVVSDVLILAIAITELINAL